jgi:hypothetical protein
MVMPAVASRGGNKPGCDTQYGELHVCALDEDDAGAKFAESQAMNTGSNI